MNEIPKLEIYQYNTIVSEPQKLDGCICMLCKNEKCEKRENEDYKPIQFCTTCGEYECDCEEISELEEELQWTNGKIETAKCSECWKPVNKCVCDEDEDDF